MLALQRDKRATAGNKMFKLLEAEDEDDFYKTTYGGFEEVQLFLKMPIYNTGLSQY